MLLEPSIIEELSPSPGIMPLSLLSPPNAELPSAIDELEEDEDDEELGLLLEELDESSLPQQPGHQGAGQGQRERKGYHFLNQQSIIPFPGRGKADALL